jgi:hypothetical protein
MNGTQLKCILVMAAIDVVGLGPLCITCLLGMGILVGRPEWFRVLVRDLYQGKGALAAESRAGEGQPNSLSTRVKCFLALSVLMVVDILPVPVAGSIGMYVAVLRPMWFRDLVDRIYGGLPAPSDGQPESE